MSNRLDLVGQHFGKLLVLKRLKRKAKNGTAYWLCQCDCGKTKEIRTTGLKNGKTKSCGCNPSGKKRSKDNAFRTVFRRYKSQAKTRGYEFHLSKDEVKQLTSNNCYYCGKEPEQIAKASLRNLDNQEIYIYNGIDRLDNFKGYITENVVSCCKICNQMKHILGYEQFINHIKQILCHIKQL